MKQIVCIGCGTKVEIPEENVLHGHTSYTMACQKCSGVFPEPHIQTSHDVPKYVGGTDADGRHNICKKCHDIYERTVFSVMVKPLSPQIQSEMRERAKKFAVSYFSKQGVKDGKAIR